MDNEKIIQHIQENYKAYQWHKKVVPTSTYFCIGVLTGQKLEWETYYEAQIGGKEYKEQINERYGTGSIYIVVTKNYHISVHYYPEDGGFYETSVSCNLYNLVAEYQLQQEIHEKANAEKEKQIREQQYEKDIARKLGIK